VKYCFISTTAFLPFVQLLLFICKQHQKNCGTPEKIGFFMHWETACLVQKWVVSLITLSLCETVCTELLSEVFGYSHVFSFDTKYNSKLLHSVHCWGRSSEVKFVISLGTCFTLLVIGKGKGSLTLDMSVVFWGWSRCWAVSPHITKAIKLAVDCITLSASARSWLPSQPHGITASLPRNQIILHDDRGTCVNNLPRLVQSRSNLELNPRPAHVMSPYWWMDTMPSCRYPYKTVDSISSQLIITSLDAKLGWLMEHCLRQNPRWHLSRDACLQMTEQCPPLPSHT